MKLNTVLARMRALLPAALCALVVAFSPNAGALAIGDDHELGFVEFGIPTDDASVFLYVNHLIGMTPGADDSADGQHYVRSTNDFGVLPSAKLDGHVAGTSTTVDLGGGGLYSFLFAKWDGPDFGAEVWYVGDLSGMIALPAFTDRYGLSGWMSFAPEAGASGSVPEGSTVALLGAALAAFAITRRYRRRTNIASIG